MTSYAPSKGFVVLKQDDHLFFIDRDVFKDAERRGRLVPHSTQLWFVSTIVLQEANDSGASYYDNHLPYTQPTQLYRVKKNRFGGNFERENALVTREWATGFLDKVILNSESMWMPCAACGA